MLSFSAWIIIDRSNYKNDTPFWLSASCRYIMQWNSCLLKLGRWFTKVAYFRKNIIKIALSAHAVTFNIGGWIHIFKECVQY